MDYRILEPGRLIVTARRDVRATLRHERGETFYFLEDVLRGKFFRLGTAEYAFFQALDGRRTVADAIAVTADQTGSQAITPEQALALVRWLTDAGLTVTDASMSPARLDQAQRRRAGASLKRWNPWLMRFSLGRATRMLDRLEPLGRLLFSREFIVVWVVVVGYAVLTVVGNWSQIVTARPLALGWQGVARLFTAWCLLKVLHETAHALACRRFGGTVGDFGVALILGMPSPFVDVSSVWRLADKRRRIVVSLAGVYVELLVAATAVFVWSQASDGVVRQMALAVATVASIGTLVFNLNPLMRFDGYFAFSDWVEIPNLASAAHDELRRAARRFALGIDEPATNAGTRRPRWTAWYGAAAAAWRAAVAVSLVLFALARFGAVVTGMLCLLPAAYFIGRIFTWLRSRRTTMRPAGVVRYRRLVRNYGLVAACLAASFAWYDPRDVRLAAVVDYEPLHVLRAATPGFVATIHVTDGQPVAANQLLVELTNPELAADIAAAEQAVAQSSAKSRIHREAGEIAKEQAETSTRIALELKLRELLGRREALSIRAPCDGLIVSRGLAALQDCRLEEGAVVASVGNEAEKELLVAVAQYDADLLRSRAGAGATAVCAGSSNHLAVAVGELEPKAERSLIHPALSVENGGDLPVAHREEPDGEGSGEMKVVTECHQPYFRLHGRFAASDAAGIAAGRRATLIVHGTWADVLRRSWTRLESWIGDKTGS